MFSSPVRVNDPLEFLLFVCFEFKHTWVCCKLWQSCGQRHTSLKSWLVYFLNEVSPSMLVHTQRELFNSAWLVSCTVANVVFVVLVPPLSSFFLFFPLPFLTKLFKWQECYYNKLAKLQVLQNVDQRKQSSTIWLWSFVKLFCHCMLDYVFWQASQSSICLVTCICCREYMFF